MSFFRSFLTQASKHSKVWHLLISLEVFSWIVWSPSSIVKKVFLFRLIKYSKHSSLIASGRVAIDRPTTFSSFKIASYFSFSIFTSAYVLVCAWKYPMYLALGHFLWRIFLTSLNCLTKSSLLLPANSPLPLLEQYMQPPVPIVPSILGQLKPAFKLTLKTLHPNFCL